MSSKEHIYARNLAGKFYFGNQAVSFIFGDTEDWTPRTLWILNNYSNTELKYSTIELHPQLASLLTLVLS